MGCLNGTENKYSLKKMILSMWFLQVLLMDKHPPGYFYTLISLFRIILRTHLSGSPNNVSEL